MNRSAREPAPSRVPADMPIVRGLDNKLPTERTAFLQAPGAVRALHSRRLCCGDGYRTDSPSAAVSQLIGSWHPPLAPRVPAAGRCRVSRPEQQLVSRRCLQPREKSILSVLPRAVLVHLSAARLPGKCPGGRTPDDPKGPLVEHPGERPTRRRRIAPAGPRMGVGPVRSGRERPRCKPGAPGRRAEFRDCQAPRPPAVLASDGLDRARRVQVRRHRNEHAPAGCESSSAGGSSGTVRGHRWGSSRLQVLRCDGDRGSVWHCRPG